MKAHYADIGIDYLQSAFSLKIGLVLISSSAIANHDVIITKGNETRREKTVSIFSSRTYALVSRGSRLCRSRAQVSRAVTLQKKKKKIRDCSQSNLGIVNVIRQFTDCRLRTVDRRMKIVDCKLLNAKRIQNDQLGKALFYNRYIRYRATPLISPPKTPYEDI